MKVAAVEDEYSNDPEQFEVDSRITYPSYKSFDEFIDIERLRLLDAYIADGIRRHIKTQKEDYFINYYRLDESMPYQPGVREIWLSRTKPGTPYDDLDLDQTDLWERTEAAGEFGLLMDFIETLPFKSKGRMLIIYDDAGLTVPAHRDHVESEICHEFIWFRTNLKKPFYVLNHETGEKKYVTSHSVWFDSVNQFHGSDSVAEGLSFSIRVDGAFTDEFRKLIPKPEFNLASTPSLWACVS
jgi:hypothetical protein